MSAGIDPREMREKSTVSRSCGTMSARGGVWMAYELSLTFAAVPSCQRLYVSCPALSNSRIPAGLVNDSLGAKRDKEGDDAGSFSA